MGEVFAYLSAPTMIIPLSVIKLFLAFLLVLFVIHKLNVFAGQITQLLAPPQSPFDAQQVYRVACIVLPQMFTLVVAASGLVTLGTASEPGIAIFSTSVATDLLLTAIKSRLASLDIILHVSLLLAVTALHSNDGAITVAKINIRHGSETLIKHRRRLLKPETTKEACVVNVA